MNKICRLCLEEGVLSSIFTKNFNLSLCDMIEYCCNLKVKVIINLRKANRIFMCIFHLHNKCGESDLILGLYFKFTDQQK